MNENNNAVELLKLQTEIERLKKLLATSKYAIRELLAKIREQVLSRAELEIVLLEARYFGYTGDVESTEFLSALEQYGYAMAKGETDGANAFYDKLVELFNNSQYERDYHKAESQKQFMLCWLEKYKYENGLEGEKDEEKLYR